MEIEKANVGNFQELKAIIPSHVFDAHAHIYRKADLNSNQLPYVLPQLEIVSIDYWKSQLSKQLCNAELVGGLFCPYPWPNCDIEASNDWVIGELGRHTQSRGLLLIRPQDDADMVEGLLANPRIIGFKPYHFFSQVENTYEATLDDYLPQWAWEIAHEKGLVLLIHLVRRQALADPDNARQLREKSLKYPHAKIVLAHAARGFYSKNTVNGIKSLVGLQNVYFDSSAICEPLALFTILKEFGSTRLFWGSDFPICQVLGRCVSVGNGFMWVDSSSVKWENQPNCSPIPVGLESIHAIKEAGDYFGLKKIDYQNIFCDNAMRLFGVQWLQKEKDA